MATKVRNQHFCGAALALEKTGNGKRLGLRVARKEIKIKIKIKIKSRGERTHRIEGAYNLITCIPVYGVFNWPMRMWAKGTKPARWRVLREATLAGLQRAQGMAPSS